MKRFAGTWAMLAVLAALAGYFFLVDLPQEQKEREAKERNQHILTFKFEDVEQFAYQHGEVQVTAKKTIRDWRLSEPLEVAADSMTIATLLNQIESVLIARVVEEQPRDLARFGLATPQFRLKVKTPELGEKTVLIGDTAPSGHALYFKRGDEDRVLMVPGLPENWAKTVFDFRDKTLLAYPVAQVTTLTLVQPKHTLELKKQDGHWQLLQPVQARGDDAAIEDLLNLIRHARITAFDEEQPQDLARYGLDALKYKLQVTTPEGTHELWAGGPTPSETHFARRASTENVFQIPKRVMAGLQSSYLELIDKQVMPIQEDQVTQLEIRNKEQTLRLVRAPEDQAEWKLVVPLQAKADTPVVNSLLFDLTDTRAKKFVTFGTLEAFGLQSPQQVLSVTQQDGRVETLALGNTNLEGDAYFLSRSLDQAVFVLDKTTVDKLFRSLDDLRDRQLVSVPAQQAHTILLQFPDQTFELIRHDKEWNLVQPERIEHLKSYIGDDIVWTLNNLRFEKELSEDKAKPVDFKHPALIVSVTDAAHQSMARVTVGRAVEGQPRRTLRVEGRPGLFHISDRFLSEIPHEIEKFRQAQNS